MQALSPFIPLDVEDSSFPATLMRFTVKNTSAAKVDLELGGLAAKRRMPRNRKNYFPARGRTSVAHDPKALLLQCGLKMDEARQSKATRPPIVFATFDKTLPADWKAGPLPPASAAAAATPASPRTPQKLESPPFTISRRFINFFGTLPQLRLGGYANTGLSLVVDWKIRPRFERDDFGSCHAEHVGRERTAGPERHD